MTIAQARAHRDHSVNYSVASVDGDEDTDVDCDFEEVSVELYVETGVAPQDVSMKPPPAKKASKGRKNRRTEA